MERLQRHYLGVNDVGGGHMCCEEHLLWSCNIPAVYCTTFISGGLFFNVHNTADYSPLPCCHLIVFEIVLL